jgi:hypothetical protein
MKTKNSITFTANPRMKVAEIPVLFRDAKGRFCSPNKGKTFEIKPPGAKKAFKGEIPKELRKTVAARKAFIVSELVQWSKAQTQKKAKTYKQKLTATAKKKREKAPSKAETKRRSVLRQKIEEAVVRETGKIPPSLPKLESRPLITPPKIQKFVQRSGVHHDPRHEESREGPSEYKERSFEIVKQKVELDPKRPVELYTFNTPGTAVAMREMLTPHAVKFLDQMRKESENAYIFRVETLNRVEGQTPKHEGIGTARFKVRDHIPKRDLKEYKKQYPGLTTDQILRELQIEDIKSELRELFSYFVDRYQDYLSRKVVSSMAVTGFSMEVVKGRLA